MNVQGAAMMRIWGNQFYITICLFILAMYLIDDKFIYMCAALTLASFFCYKFHKFTKYQLRSIGILVITIIFQFLILNSLPYHQTQTSSGQWPNILKLLIVVLPLLSYIRFYNEISILPFTFSENNDSNRLYSLNQIKNNSKELAEALTEIALDLPRHSSFRYINSFSLNKEYFDAVDASMDDPNIYLLLSHTGSNASKVISQITKSNYNHISLAFDYELNTTVSFNNGNDIYRPGLNLESLKYFNQTPDANIIVYRYRCTVEQKQNLSEQIQKINNQGSSYNLLGLVTPLSTRENILYCSEFVYKILSNAGLQYFPPQKKIKPQDFIEKDYHRKLEYCYDVFFKDE